jgi:2,5-furandicarboxylate decarboxylase 1
MWIGHHPAACIGGQAKLGYPESHWESMGGLLDEPLRLVPTETWGDQLLVPADAEIVIEGVIPKNQWKPAGQFGDWARYLIPSKPAGVVEVTCITFRKNAYFHDIVTGCADHQVGGSFSIAASLYSNCKKIAPEVVNVHLPLSGMCRATAYIQVKNPKPGKPKRSCIRRSRLTIESRVFLSWMMMWIYSTRERSCGPLQGALTWTRT